MVGSFGNATYLVLLGLGQLAAVIVWGIYLSSKQKNRLTNRQITDNRQLKTDNRIPKRYLLPTLTGVMLYNIGTITYAAALEHGLASIVQALSELSILLTIILSVIYLKERLTLLQTVGILLTLIGAALIGNLTA